MKLISFRTVLNHRETLKNKKNKKLKKPENYPIFKKMGQTDPSSILIKIKNILYF